MLNKEVSALNRIFIKNITAENPCGYESCGFLDGKIPLKTGNQNGLHPPVKKRSAKLRRMCDAILVGVNTVINDNPFDCRIDKSKN